MKQTYQQLLILCNRFRLHTAIFRRSRNSELCFYVTHFIIIKYDGILQLGSRTYCYRYIRSLLYWHLECLTLILLTWTIWRAPTNASKWRMGFNSAFKWLIQEVCYIHTPVLYITYFNFTLYGYIKCVGSTVGEMTTKPVIKHWTLLLKAGRWKTIENNLALHLSFQSSRSLSLSLLS